MRGGGICIFVAEKLAPFVEINSPCTVTNKDFEILTLNVTKPNMRHMMLSCLYKPPIGKTDKLIEFLNRMYLNVSREIWLLGDFNVDNLDRGNESRLKYLNFVKKTGLKQLINKCTRLNCRGGTCLDWISTNCDFVNTSGVIDILISDHLPV